MLMDGQTTDARVTGILIAYLGAFSSGELKTEHSIEERKDKKKDDNEKTETHTITEKVPVANLDKENTTQNVQKIRKTVKTNDNIRYKVQNKEEWTIATVLGRAGKAHW